jgi:hypothetical protein
MFRTSECVKYPSWTLPGDKRCVSFDLVVSWAGVGLRAVMHKVGTCIASQT